MFVGSTETEYFLSQVAKIELLMLNRIKTFFSSSSSFHFMGKLLVLFHSYFIVLKLIISREFKALRTYRKNKYLKATYICNFGPFSQSN